jgi:WD40 repeat protein/DNA-binding SARP family transcriptional activator
VLVRVLGSCRIEGHDALGRRDRVVLAALVVAGTAAVRADRLAEALYGDELPPTWRKVVQGCILRLRHGLGARAIQTTPDGYRLVVGDDEVDARRFERMYERAIELIEVGQAERAVPLLRDALALFEGEPLVELDGWATGRDEANRLVELHRRGEERLVEALLSDGRVDEATALAVGLAGREPLREQRWALLAQAYYRSDRQADALRAVGRARKLLREELGVDPGPALAAIERAVLVHDPVLGSAGGGARRPAAVCPYKGLAVYDTADADAYFGRAEDVAACVGRLLNTGVLAIVGSSGTGKSSLARAGIVPAILRRGHSVVVFTPGADPVGRLAGIDPQSAIVVDQLEELFTITATDAERVSFADALDRRALRAPIVLTLRADFVAAVSALPPLARLVQDGLQLLGPMSEAQLRAAIAGPADRAGLHLEPGLIDVLLRDVEGRAGALPLLSHALVETWAHRDDRVLTVAGYQAGGGVEGAVAATADQVMDRLSPDGRRIARSVLLRLVSLSDAGAPVSHRVRRVDLVRDDRYDDVLDALLAARLLVADADSVEVTHEALGRAWPRLRTWLDEDRDGQRTLRHLSATAAEWDRAGRDEAELYRGARLRTAEEWVGAAEPDLTEAEHAFLERSIALRKRDEADLVARETAQRRTNRRLRALLAGVAVLLVVALITGGLFLDQRNQAQATTRAATARRLASQSTVALDQDPELAVLLALEAVKATRSVGEPPPPEALSALQQATQASRVELRRAEGSLYLDASKDGRRFVSGSSDPASAIVWDGATGDKLHTLTSPGATIAEVAISPDGGLVATDDATADDRSAPLVIVWDVATGREVSRLVGPAQSVVTGGFAFSPDGRMLVASSEQTGMPGRVTVWDVASATERFSFEPVGGAGPIAFRTDPSTLMIAGDDARVRSFSLEDGTMLDSIATPGVADPSGIAVDPTGRLLAISSQSPGVTQVWDLLTRKQVSSVDGEAGAVSWSPRGDRIVVAGVNQSPVRVIDARSGREVMVLRGLESGSWDVAFLSGGDRVAGVGYAGGLRVWDVTDAGPPALHALAPRSYPDDLVFSADGSEMIAVTQDGTVDRIASETGRVLGALPGQRVGAPGFSPVVSPDWRRLATVRASDGRAVVRDLRTFDPQRDLPPCANPLAFSPNGSLLVLDGLTSCTPQGGPAPYQPPAGALLESRVIDVASGKDVLRFGRRHLVDATFNPGGQFAAGRYLAVNIDDSTIEIYDMATRRLLTSLEFGDDAVFSVAFDPRGRWLAGGTAGGKAWALDMTSVVAGVAAKDAIVFDKTVDQGVTAAVALSADGLLATAGLGDGRVDLWRISSGQLVVQLQAGLVSNESAPLEFSPDGTYLLYSDGGVLRRYPLDADRLIALARSRLTRGLTTDECRQYLTSSHCG